MPYFSSAKKAVAACCAAFIVFILYAAGIPVRAAGEEAPLPSQLYARCAVLMDADTGRILYAKNGDEEAPMASTTKIMTCILALENGSLTDPVTVSENAQNQPEVRLGIKEGDEFCLNDLLYSLMLESHNDSAVAIAEHIGGSTAGFADMMNRKAASIGCSSTYFITPNGLDAKDENGIHHTTAADLSLIMRYCIMQSPQRETFLKITRTDTYSFSDCSGQKAYFCRNHNAFLKMMDGALCGKTGFTADAGYCYVGALEDRGRTFIVALLACGWPNNKSYKWSDTRKLMNYGLENYQLYTLRAEDPQLCASVKNGYISGFPGADAVKISVTAEGESTEILLGHNEKAECEIELQHELNAPVKKGESLGRIYYTVNGFEVAEFKLKAGESVNKRKLEDCLKYVRNRYFFQL